MTIALVVGHTEDKKGAKNKSFGVYEYNINNKLAKDIKKILSDKVDIVYRLNGYKNLPSDISKIDPKFILSLHSNAFNTKASGSETLYYHKSKTGKMIAQVFQNLIVKSLGLKDRGIKSKTAEDRGGYLLKYTQAPCIIMEPYFIDNDDDFTTYLCKYKNYVENISNTIEEVSNQII